MQKLILPTSVGMGNYKRDTYHKKDCKLGKKGDIKNKIGDLKKPYSLNLNVLRNSSSFMIKAADTRFREHIKENYEIDKVSKLAIVYVLYVGSTRRKDLNNVTSVIDKFFADTLTDMGVIEDDNFRFYRLTTSIFGGIDKGKDRVEAYLIDTDNEEYSTIIKDLIDTHMYKGDL